MPGGARQAPRAPATPAWPQLAGGLAAIVALLVVTGACDAGFVASFAWLLLFSRFEKSSVLRNERRSRLYDVIRENPGLSQADLQRCLGCGSGALLHHLRMLERQELVRPLPDGFRRRWYVRGPRVDPEAYLTQVQSRLLGLVEAAPGAFLRELATEARLSRPAARYQLGRLEAMGKVRSVRTGRHRRFQANPGSPASHRGADRLGLPAPLGAPEAPSVPPDGPRAPA